MARGREDAGGPGHKKIRRTAFFGVSGKRAPREAASGGSRRLSAALTHARMGKGGESSALGLKKVSVAELRKHSTAGDGWVAINGKVYDVSQYVNQHPGGRVLLSALGEPDASGALAVAPPPPAHTRRPLPPPLAGRPQFSAASLTWPWPTPPPLSSPASTPLTLQTPSTPSTRAPMRTRCWTAFWWARWSAAPRTRSCPRRSLSASTASWA